MTPPQANTQVSAGAPGARVDSVHHTEKDIVNIGKSVVIKGELNGSEDLTVEGKVEGTIQLREHVLTIGPNGRIKAEVFAKSVIVLGEVVGNVSASEKVDIRDNGSIDGDIVSPRVAIADPSPQTSIGFPIEDALGQHGAAKLIHGDVDPKPLTETIAIAQPKGRAHEQ